MNIQSLNFNLFVRQPKKSKQTHVRNGIKKVIIPIWKSIGYDNK